MRCILLLILCITLSARAATNVAASLSTADIQAAVDLSVDYDTVRLPAGSNALTTRVLITNHINFIGAGSNATILVDEIASRDHMIRFYYTNWTTTNIATIAGIQFKGGDVETSTASQGIIMVVGSPWRTNGAYSSWRLTRCWFNVPRGRPASIYSFGNYLLDSNRVDAITSGFRIDGRTPSSVEKGDSAWAHDIGRGQTNCWGYFEGNVFVRTNTPGAITDSFTGTRYVFRYNACTNVAAENHGTDSAGRYRSGRDMEIYGNTFHATIAGEYAIHSRGGSGLAFSNSVTGSFPGTWRGLNYRILENLTVPWGAANGTNLWDLNDATEFATGTHTGGNGVRLLEDSGASFTPQTWSNIAHVINLNSGASGWISSNGGNWIATYNDIHNSLGASVYWTNGNTYTVRKVIRALDGSGNGTGALLTGSSDTTNPTPHEWPAQDEDPWYIWANTGTTNVSNSGDYTMVAGRDYIFGTAAPGYTPLVYPHPFANIQPSPPAGTTIRATNFNAGTVIFGP